ncbi:MAG: MBL fold metallo-hydrolase [Candidatus Woesearchaeota archaeon]|nr:MAG: MBL fold metallo-hydrolase [Candidatus Woesearchaeota archaeon]
MAEFKVLVEGYARKEDGCSYVSSTTTLIKENGLNIIVDPGMNRELLLESLQKEGLSTKDINYVILTHYHIDHSALVGIFENAEILDDGEIYSFKSTIKNHDGKIPGTDIEIIGSLGHAMFHCSLIVKTEDYGTVVIAGDVLWWRETEEQKTDKKSLIEHKDPFVKNEEQLIESRKKIIDLADYIIPGHGKMFKVEK